jgi:hypothetical protein
MAIAWPLVDVDKERIDKSSQGTLSYKISTPSETSFIGMEYCYPRSKKRPRSRLRNSSIGMQHPGVSPSRTPPEIIVGTTAHQQRVGTTGTELVPAEIQAKIQSFERGPNFGSQGAQAITKEACQTAIVFLGDVIAHGIPMPKSCSPSVLGAVMIYWKLKNGKIFAQFKDGNRSRIYFQMVDSSGKSKEGFATWNSVLDKVQRLAGDS